MINLVRDLLDQLLVDRHDRYIGRVDGIVLELRRDRPPKVVALEIGIATVAYRIHPRLGRIIAPIAARFGAEAVRLPLSAIRDVGVDIHLDVDGDREQRERPRVSQDGEVTRRHRADDREAHPEQQSPQRGAGGCGGDQRQLTALLAR